MIYAYIFLTSIMIAVVSIYYFDFSSKIKYFILLSILLFATLFLFKTYFTDFILENIIIMLEIIIFVFIYNRQIYHEVLTVSLMLMIAKSISKIISLNIIQLFTHQSIQFILNHQNYSDFMILIELILFTLTCLNIYLLKIKTSINFNHKNWRELEILLSLIFISLTFFEYILITNQDMKQIILIISLTLLALSVFFIFTYNKILILSQENTEYLLNEQKHHYRSINKDTLLKANEEMKVIEHRMSYSLLQIKDAIIKNDYDNALSIIDQYFHKIDQYKSSLLTDNPYFDFVINSKVNTLYNNGYSLKITSSLNYNPILESQENINTFIHIIDYYTQLSDDKDLSIEFIDKGDFLLITITTLTYISTEEITNEIKEMIPSYTHYHLKSNHHYVTCQLLFKQEPLFHDRIM